jgi:hypothetical protein
MRFYDDPRLNLSCAGIIFGELFGVLPYRIFPTLSELIAHAP